MLLQFALFGHPVAHSLSPAMHAANFKALGMDAVYEKRDVPPERLGSAIAAAASAGCAGLNLTIPHKKAALEVVSRLAPSAAAAGAVNTVQFHPDGTATGHNTDSDGFFEDLAERGIDASGMRVAVIGCGGAGTALAAGFAARGAREILLCNRSPGKAEALAARVPRARALPPGGFSPETIRALSGCDILVNATAAGLSPHDPPAIPTDALRPGMAVCDIVPVARETALCRAAREAGATAVNGLGMLLHQAAIAFRIWTGMDADVSAMRKALAEAAGCADVWRPSSRRT